MQPARISDHLLEIVRLNGGRVHPADFDRWIGVMAEKNYLVKEFVQENGCKTIYWYLSPTLPKKE